MTRARHIAAAHRDIAAYSTARHRKTCAAITCDQQLVPGRIFCPNHWFFLDPWMRAAILNTFSDGEWDAHQQAVCQGADFIDAAFVAAREAGFDTIISARRGDGVAFRYFGKAVA